MSKKRDIRDSKRKRSGYVYILSNPSIKGIKIGLTERKVEERIKELNRATGVPTAFKIEYQVATPDCYRLERAMHKHYSKKRINNRREFFKLPVWRARRRLKLENAKITGIETITFKFVLVCFLSLSLVSYASYLMFLSEYDISEAMSLGREHFGLIKNYLSNLISKRASF